MSRFAYPQLRPGPCLASFHPQEPRLPLSAEEQELTQRAAWALGKDGAFNAAGIFQLSERGVMTAETFDPLRDLGDAFRLALDAGVVLDHRASSVGAVARFGEAPAVREYVVIRKGDTPQEARYRAGSLAIVKAVILAGDR